MKYYLLALVLMLSSYLFGQGGYYVTIGGDTVRCEFKKCFPRSIKVKTEQNGTQTLETDEVVSFVKDGVPFVRKKIVNQEKRAYIFLPNDKVDRKYQYSDPNLVMMSGKGITFYELEEFGGVETHGGMSYGRSATITFYVENDSLGLTKVPQMQAIGSSVEKIDVIRALSGYLNRDEATAKKLSEDESWKTFNYKGIRKLISGYIGKEFVD